MRVKSRDFCVRPVRQAFQAIYAFRFNSLRRTMEFYFASAYRPPVSASAGRQAGFASAGWVHALALPTSFGASSEPGGRTEAHQMTLAFSDEEMDLLLELPGRSSPRRGPPFWTQWPQRSGSRRAGRASFTRPRGGSRGISGRRPSCRPTRPRPCDPAC
jgi:hypothetical protein